MAEYITLGHGSGGKLTHDLIGNLFALKFGMSQPMTDSAVLLQPGFSLAFTTDSYVVDPLFFPGGDIGKLAVCGTINDLAVSGADPLCISASFILEEGFSYVSLERIADSMAREATLAGVSVVTGDTKVVEKGKCDKIFINTSGIGLLKPEHIPISYASEVKPGDVLIVNGPLASHAVAVMAARNQLRISADVISDCASLNRLVREVLDAGIAVKFMRDITRGGLATVLNELSGITGTGIFVNEENIPVDEAVRGYCEILGFDPLYMANEGKLLMVIGRQDVEKTLEILRNNPLGIESRVIGEMNTASGGRVLLQTIAGGTRILDVLTGAQLPRIC